jgi:hypothetical protein
MVRPPVAGTGVFGQWHRSLSSASSRELDFLDRAPRCLSDLWCVFAVSLTRGFDLSFDRYVKAMYTNYQLLVSCRYLTNVDQLAHLKSQHVTLLEKSEATVADCIKALKDMEARYSVMHSDYEHLQVSELGDSSAPPSVESNSRSLRESVP